MRHPSSTRSRNRAATYNVWQIADESHDADLPGGVLESAGRLFKRSVKMYVYPTRDPVSGQIHSVERAPLWPRLGVDDLVLQILETGIVEVELAFEGSIRCISSETSRSSWPRSCGPCWMIVTRLPKRRYVWANSRPT